LFGLLVNDEEKKFYNTDFGPYSAACLSVTFFPAILSAKQLKSSYHRSSLRGQQLKLLNVIKKSFENFTSFFSRQILTGFSFL
jgi:hypothetical protein